MNIIGSDLKKEIENIKKAFHREYTTHKHDLIVDPRLFKSFCDENGASTIFENVLEAMTQERHSDYRRQINENKAMEIIYKMCYGRSQKCSHFQNANGLYLKMSRITSEGELRGLIKVKYFRL